MRMKLVVRGANDTDVGDVKPPNASRIMRAVQDGELDSGQWPQLEAT